MTQEGSRILLSYDDYAAIDDGRRYQVIAGELVLTPSPRLSHQQAALYLWRVLDDYARISGAGKAVAAPFDVVLRAERPAVVVQPDVLFVKREHIGIMTPANVQGAPDLAIEVLSPSSMRLDAVIKRGIYAQYGVPEYWIISVEAEQIEVFAFTEGDRFGRPVLFKPGDRLTSPRLPGFELDVSALFARAAEK